MNELMNYPDLYQLSLENDLFFKVVGSNGVFIDDRFNGWGVEPLTPDSKIPMEVVKRIYLINSLGYQITGGMILHEPKKKTLPWGKIALATGIVIGGVVGIYIAAVIALAVLRVLGQIMSVLGVMAVIALMVLVDPVYILTLSDGTLLQIYSSHE